MGADPGPQEIGREGVDSGWQQDVLLALQLVSQSPEASGKGGCVTAKEESASTAARVGYDIHARYVQ